MIWPIGCGGPPSDLNEWPFCILRVLYFCVIPHDVGFVRFSHGFVFFKNVQIFCIWWLFVFFVLLFCVFLYLIMGLRVLNCLCVFVPVLPSNKGAVGFWWEKRSFRFFAKGGVCLAYDGSLYLPCRISHAWESNSFIRGPCGLALVPSFLLSAPFPRLWCSVLKKNLALLTIAEISVF